MFETLAQNLQLIAILIVSYLGALGINTLLGIYYNLSTLQQTFSKEKLIAGLIRGGIILISGLVLTVTISLLPELLKAFGISTETDLFNNISIVAMAGVLVSTIIKYLTDALTKFYEILGLFGDSLKNKQIEAADIEIDEDLIPDEPEEEVE